MVTVSITVTVSEGRVTVTTSTTVSVRVFVCVSVRVSLTVTVRAGAEIVSVSTRDTFRETYTDTVPSDIVWVRTRPVTVFVPPSLVRQRTTRWTTPFRVTVTTSPTSVTTRWTTSPADSLPDGTASATVRPATPEASSTRPSAISRRGRLMSRPPPARRAAVPFERGTAHAGKSCLHPTFA